MIIFIIRVTSHPRTVKASGIFTTTGRILFYNSWKDNFGKLQVYCSEFHEWQIHLNSKHGVLYWPYSLVPDLSTALVGGGVYATLTDDFITSE